MICTHHHSGACNKGSLYMRTAHEAIPRECRTKLEPGGSRRKCCAGCEVIEGCERACREAVVVRRAK